jgi:hypothetical protein
MARFEIADGERVRLVKATIAYDTVIAAGDLVTLDTGLIIKAVAASTAVAWCPLGHASGATTDTTCEVTVGNDFTLRGTLDTTYLGTHQGTVCTIDDTTQEVDVSDTGGTDLIIVGIGESVGVVGVASGVEVRINKPLF